MVCNPCGKIFYHQSTFKVQFKQRHECDDGEAICTVCGNEFKNIFQVKNHFTNYHTTKECEDCGNKIPSGNYARHLKMHKKVPRKDNLVRHVNQHQVEPAKGNYQCDLCQKCFAEKRYLKSHKKTHMEKEEEQTRFKCEYCQKDYSKRSNMNAHMNTKHPISTAKQTLVAEPNVGYFLLEKDPSPIKFNVVINVKNQKVHKCQYCEYENSRPDNLKRHIQTVHETIWQISCHLI